MLSVPTAMRLSRPQRRTLQRLAVPPSPRRALGAVRQCLCATRVSRRRQAPVAPVLYVRAVRLYPKDAGCRHPAPRCKVPLQVRVVASRLRLKWALLWAWVLPAVLQDPAVPLGLLDLPGQGTALLGP